MLIHSARRICHRWTGLQTFFMHRSMQQSIHTHSQVLVPEVIIKQRQFARSQFSFTPVERQLGPFCCSHARNFSDVASNPKPVFLSADVFKSHTAIVCQHGSYTYTDILHYSSSFASRIIDLIKNTNPDKVISDSFYLNGERVAILCDNDVSYVIATWAVWLLGGVTVPLCKSHPISEMEYFVENSGATLLLASENFHDMLESIAGSHQIPLLVLGTSDYGGLYQEQNVWVTDRGLDLGTSLRKCLNEDGFRDKNATIVYTSGTTGRPKGVVHTFGSLEAQMCGMVDTWGWTKNDNILHVLPLHHVHGIVNVLLTSLYSGATCVMLNKFDPLETWKMLLCEDPNINVFMAVPTIYVKLLEEYDRQITMSEPTVPQIEHVRDILKHKLRLMVSGSAALPQPVMRKWEEVTGHTLLERYGMTEIGMALTNPLEGVRTPGAVGQPFPGVSVRIVSHHDNDTGYDIIAEADSQTTTETPGKEGESGELLVKGDNLFTEYWNKPEATRETFTDDGWFKTGDTAVYEDGVFRIVGRTSVDVIKSGAYKISALDIERHLLEHPAIQEVAVIGLPDETWGQIVGAVVALKGDTTLTLQEVKHWSRDHMASYQIPRVLKVVSAIPRNAMGKVNKKQLMKDMFPEYFNTET